MRKLFTIYIFVILFASCNDTNYKLNHINSSKLAFNLIKLCVDSTIVIEKNINTTNYVVDLSAIQNINKAGKDSFTEYKATVLPTTHEDSVIVFEDSSWEKFHMAKSMIVKFDSIQIKDQERVMVVMRKFKSSDYILSLKFQMERRHDGYICTDVKRINEK